MRTKVHQQGYRADPFQEEVIACRALGIRVVAPAGSGKTETLVRRTVERIQADRIEPRRILVLTFDNAAKRSFEQKFKELAPRSPTPVISTLNAFGKKLLQDRFRTEYAETVKEDDQRDIRRVFGRHEHELPVLHWDGRYRSLVDGFASLKNRGYAPVAADADKAEDWLRSRYLGIPASGESFAVGDHEIDSEAITSTEPYKLQVTRIFNLYCEYDAFLRARGRMDLTDQKLRALRCLREHADVRREIVNLYHEIVVDECQDINRLEALLIWIITGEQTTLVLAGDDDQSLYEFREADSLYLREPERFFKDRSFETCHLNINYRTPQEILGRTLRLISHNLERLDKSPTSGVARMGSIDLVAANTITRHDQELLENIRVALGADQISDAARPDDIGVLCPDDASRRRLRAALAQIGIPVAEFRQGQQIRPGIFVETMRMAKGRQWRIVVLPMSNDRIMPGGGTVRSGELESARRQYYVAMTRASERLIIGYIRDDAHDELHQTSRGETWGTNGPSRFLFEAGLVVSRSSNIDAVHGAPDVALPASNTNHTQFPSPFPIRNGRTETTAPPVDANPSVLKAMPPVVQPVPVAPNSADHSSAKLPPTASESDVVSVAPAPKRKRATRPWELRQEERNALARAQKKLIKDDPSDDPVTPSRRR